MFKKICYNNTGHSGKGLLCFAILWHMLSLLLVRKCDLCVKQLSYILP